MWHGAFIKALSLTVNQMKNALTVASIFLNVLQNMYINNASMPEDSLGIVNGGGGGGMVKIMHLMNIKRTSE